MAARFREQPDVIMGDLDVSLNGKPAGTLPSEPANVVITRSGIRLL